jgi:hypothetical protein
MRVGVCNKQIKLKKTKKKKKKMEQYSLGEFSCPKKLGFCVLDAQK